MNLLAFRSAGRLLRCLNRHLASRGYFNLLALVAGLTRCAAVGILFRWHDTELVWSLYLRQAEGKAPGTTHQSAERGFGPRLIVWFKIFLALWMVSFEGDYRDETRSVCRRRFHWSLCLRPGPADLSSGDFRHAEQLITAIFVSGAVEHAVCIPGDRTKLD